MAVSLRVSMDGAAIGQSSIVDRGTDRFFSILVYRIAAKRHVVSAINEPQMDLLIRSQRSTAHPGLPSAADSPSLTDDFDIKLLSRFSSNDARRPIRLLCGRREE